MHHPTRSPCSLDTHASNNQQQLAIQEFTTSRGSLHTHYMIVMQIYKCILQVLPTLLVCLFNLRRTSYGVTRLASDTPLSHHLLTLIVDISKKSNLMIYKQYFFSFTTVHHSAHSKTRHALIGTCKKSSERKNHFAKYKKKVSDRKLFFFSYREKRTLAA